MPRTMPHGETLRRCTSFDVPANTDMLKETQLLGDVPPSAQLMHAYLQNGEVWCASARNETPETFIGFMPFGHLQAPTCPHEMREGAKTIGEMLKGETPVLWLGFACGPAPLLPALLREAQHRAAQRYPTCILATALYARRTDSLSALFGAGFTAHKLRPMAFLRPCYLFLKAPAAQHTEGGVAAANCTPQQKSLFETRDVNLNNTYEISRLLEEGYTARGVQGLNLHLERRREY